MMISYKNKFIFIHNRKVAGTSIKNALKNYGVAKPTKFHEYNKFIENFNTINHLNSIISNRYLKKILYRKHATAKELKTQLPKQLWENYFKFVFVRNPWDLQVSLYFYMLKNKNHFQHERIKQMKSFNEYIEWLVNKKVFLQKEYVFDNDNKMIVDYVGKYENLLENFDEIVKYLGLNARLPHINKSNHEAYRNYYNTYTKNLIGDAFKKDIELFSYEF